MECKFLSHGFALSYDNTVKPCCEWEVDDEWRNANHFSNINLADWHNKLSDSREQFKNGVWPSNCHRCKSAEENSNHYSVRQQGNNAYANLTGDDITLEIRPGSVCNFACQTCWPAASSRVTQYHSKAGFIDIKSVNSTAITDFDFLNNIKHRIKNVTILGGEPFYDKNCKKFLTWATDNLNSNISMYTNGSVVDLDWLQSYQGTITLTVSMDAVGRPAEYVRYGTVWTDVLNNFAAMKSLATETRVNITTSPYNYHLIENLIDFLLEDWPALVTFSTARGESTYTGAVIPDDIKKTVIESLGRSCIKMLKSDVAQDQKMNAVEYMRALITQFKSSTYNPLLHEEWRVKTKQLDDAKGITPSDYCDVLGLLLR